METNESKIPHTVEKAFRRGMLSWLKIPQKKTTEHPHPCTCCTEPWATWALEEFHARGLKWPGFKHGDASITTYLKNGGVKARTEQLHDLSHKWVIPALGITTR